MAKFQRNKGMQDILPKDISKWKYVEKTLIEVAQLYGFKEIRVPTMEFTEVFTGSVGESSDIVQKEMYTLEDMGRRSLTLRPEFTAGVVRSVIENGLLNEGLPLKLSYIGSCFRQEKPQAGRLREFHQFGVESFGSNDPSADAEIIALAKDVLQMLGLEKIRLLINSIGCPECRPKYLEELKKYFYTYKDQLDGDSLKRIDTNPMRILDSKVPSTMEIVKDAPKSVDFLCDDCKVHFDGVKNRLSLLNIDYTIAPKLVRGLDYYTNTVFEFVSDDIGSQSSVAGGGRYNPLVERMGGKPTPGLGFGMGIERLIMAMDAVGADVPEEKRCEIFVASVGDIASKKALQLSHKLREEGFYAEYDMMSRGLKAQMKYANKIGAHYCVVLGEDELIKGVGKIRNMDSGKEVEIPLGDALVDYLYTVQISDAMEELGGSIDDIGFSNVDLSMMTKFVEEHSEK